MRHIPAAFFLAVSLSGVAQLVAQTRAPALDAPLPNASDLWQRALANERKLAAERERYECRVTDTLLLTDSKGKTKRSNTWVKDEFFVNGIEIDRTLQKNGKDLTPEQTKKEDERVMKETLKYSNQAAAKKEETEQEQQAQDFMEAMMLANGHRELVNGRSILSFDIVPNPHFQARNLNQRMARVLQGNVSIDEQTGELIDMDVKSVADLKLGAGMFANVHKGFWLHIHAHPQPDGVWLGDLAEGTGDMRALLFFHPYFRFKETTDSCHLYTATAVQVGEPKVVKTN
ncbi:MAG: hypothetical protein ACP5E2_13855 [Terracidiphilus sp.]